ncbi:hypothetical protein O6H91_19G007800 [Diphasiastrum complanatum]|uniref:Uncharacterized protein n=1 Tax=Diphasiastrum complanatum TaxID=34168 RepID=A0ACC2ASJ2_DIPCM|nr:hypothetical protein O6H91_19G007800 [Diphasiastrum complanatum]
MKISMEMVRLFVLHLNLFMINLILGSRISSCKQTKLSSISLGESLYSNQTLVSQNGVFALGFFSGSPNGLGLKNKAINAIYLGLWFADIASSPKVWVANRDLPAPTDVFLELSEEGNLILVDSNGTIFWNSATSGKDVETAVLLDTGNLILQRDSTATVVWQSFDYPTDTWLPRMKMTPETTLRSWKSLINPATGRFSLIMHDYGDLELCWNEYVSYWKSGIWNEPQRTFVDTTQTRTYVLIVTFLSNATSSYYIWMERDNQRSYIVLGEDGVLRSYAWDEYMQEWIILYSDPANVCQVEHLCGPYGICDGNTLPFCKCPIYLTQADRKGWDQNDWSMGCVQARDLNCQTDRYVALNQTSYDLPETIFTGINHSDMCEKLCSRDCTCVAFKYSADSKCFLYHGPLLNGHNSPESDGSFFLRVSGSAKPSPSWYSLNVAWIVGGVVGFIILLVLASVRLLIIRRTAVFRFHGHVFYQGFVKFSYKELQKATNNFSHTLGTGAFGSVFAGRLMDNSLVAVKKLENLTQGEKQFLAEVQTIGTIYHINLVTLRGFCAEDSHRLLVYERLPNGSLDNYIFKANFGGDQQLLDWNTRVAIALGTAKGIAYLHEDCRDCIIHFDIKPENILLDANFCAKVSDFGLAKLIGRELSRVITTMRGTRGYLAPEWLENMPITAKVDVYSYGMTVLEIISGRKNKDVKAELDRWYFPMWAYKQMKLGNFALLADERLGGIYDLEQLKKLVQVAIWCIQDEESLRPAMRQVVKMLEGVIEVVEPPIPKSLRLLET